MTTHQNKGMIISVLVHVLVVIFIFFAGFQHLDPPAPKGIIVAYGTDIDGFGNPQYNKVEQNAYVDENTYKETIEEQKLITSEESEFEIAEEPKKEDKKEKKPNVKKSEQKKLEEKPKASDATLAALANVLSDGNDKGKGDSKGDGNKGDIGGSMTSSNYGTQGQGGDGNYRLVGRKPVSKPQPEYNGKDQGRVFVRIKVNRDGQVISATAGGLGTSVSDPVLLENAEKAARATKWEANPSGEPEQSGTIIYEFKIGR